MPGDSSLVLRIHGIDVGLPSAKIFGKKEGPVAELVERNLGLFLVPNASPFERHKDDARLALVQRRAREVGAPSCLCQYDWRTR